MHALAYVFIFRRRICCGKYYKFARTCCRCISHALGCDRTSHWFTCCSRVATSFQHQHIWMGACWSCCCQCKHSISPCFMSHHCICCYQAIYHSWAHWECQYASHCWLSRSRYQYHWSFPISRFPWTFTSRWRRSTRSLKKHGSSRTKKREHDDNSNEESGTGDRHDKTQANGSAENGNNGDDIEVLGRMPGSNDFKRHSTRALEEVSSLITFECKKYTLFSRDCWLC